MSLALPRRSFLATVAAGLLGAGAPALAQPRKTPVALAGSEAATAPELTRALEAAVLEELAHTDSVRLVPENRAAFRLRASVTSLETRRRGADGRWALQSEHTGKTFFRLEKVGEPSRWNTLRALRVLRAFPAQCASHRESAAIAASRASG